MKLYRICTEDKNRKTVEILASSYFPGCSFIFGSGRWKGKKEKSLFIDYVDTGELDGIDERINRLSGKIERLNGQECVLVLSWEVEARFI